jgi:diguanylate cyclase (GGDEF)-like protein
MTIRTLHIKNELAPISLWITVTIGLATMVPKPDEQLDQLFSRADKALYLAKKKGRNCLVVSV